MLGCRRRRIRIASRFNCQELMDMMTAPLEIVYHGTNSATEKVMRQGRHHRDPQT